MGDCLCQVLFHLSVYDNIVGLSQGLRRISKYVTGQDICAQRILLARMIYISASVYVKLSFYRTIRHSLQ